MPKTEDAAAAGHCALCDCYSRARLLTCQTRTRAQQLRHVTHTITASLQQQQQQQQQYQQLRVFITTATTAVLLHAAHRPCQQACAAAAAAAPAHCPAQCNGSASNSECVQQWPRTTVSNSGASTPPVHRHHCASKRSL
eukprot:13025-Heterococcus_DN1.PRE.4